MRMLRAAAIAFVVLLCVASASFGQPAIVYNFGDITAVNQFVQLSNITGAGAIGVNITGSFTGTLNPEGSVDCVNFVSSLAATQASALSASTLPNTFASSWVSAVTGGSIYIAATGIRCVRVRASAWTSGTATVFLSSSSSGITPTFQGPSGSTIYSPWRVQNFIGTNLSVSQTSAATTAQTLTLTGGSNDQVCATHITIYSSTPATATMVVQNGGVTILDFGTLSLTAQALSFPIGGAGACTTSSSNLTLVIGAASAGTTTASILGGRSR